MEGSLSIAFASLMVLLLAEELPATGPTIEGLPSQPGLASASRACEAALNKIIFHYSASVWSERARLLDMEWQSACRRLYYRLP